jgi:hypothetical protein
MSRSAAKFRVTLERGDRILTEGVIDKNARWAFTHGYCSELSYALYERIGGAIVQIRPLWFYDRPESEWPTIHAGVVVGEAVDVLVKGTERRDISLDALDGAVMLDIEGRHRHADWMHRWRIPGSNAFIAGVVDLDEGLRIEECRAHTFVDPILEQSGLVLP